MKGEGCYFGNLVLWLHNALYDLMLLVDLCRPVLAVHISKSDGRDITRKEGKGRTKVKETQRDEDINN